MGASRYLIPLSLALGLMVAAEPSCDVEADIDGDGVSEVEGDCNDNDPSIYPGATEFCDGVDNDCDAAADEGFDQDSDGYTTCGGDCDDADPSVAPGVVEACDGADNDCDGISDEGFDEDLDGYATCAGDCDDSDPDSSPGAMETCDGDDEDCDGLVDEGFDADGDGFKACDGDCDDTEPAAYPGAPEICDDIDNDCDGRKDEGYDFDSDGFTTCGGDCRDTNALMYPGAPERCNDLDDDCDGLSDEGFDLDQDGVSLCDGDCDDGDDGVFPGAVEVCDGKDGDCDGSTDEDFDTDGDGFATCAGDCDDTKAAVNPGAYEGEDEGVTTRDGIDNDCDGYVDIDCDGLSTNQYPFIRIDSPARGTFTSATSVTVSGVVIPGREGDPISTVKLGSASISKTQCSADGGVRFEGTNSLVRGINTLRIQGIDTEGNLDKAEVSLARSDRFIDMGGPISGALIGEMNQGTWDILGDYLETFLTEQALKSELIAANPLVDDTGTGDCLDSYRIVGNATDYRHDGVELTFEVSGGKIRSTARLLRPRMWATGYAYYDLEWFCGGWDDTVNLDAYASFSEVVATANGVFSTRADGTIQVDFQNVVVDALGSYIDVDADGTVYDWLIDIFEDDMEQEVTEFVERELRQYVADDLGPLLGEELNGLNLSYTIRVLGKDYDVDFEVDNVTVPTGTVAVAFDMGVDYNPLLSIPSNPGAVGFPQGFSHTTSPTVAFKVGLDFFNASLHALWEGGSLHISEQVSDDPEVFVTAIPLLPPVAVPGTGGDLLKLQIGDAKMILEIPSGGGGMIQTLNASASATVPMNLTPIVEGEIIRFDVDFGAVILTFDLLAEEALEPELQADMERGLSQMLTLYLDELEAYLEDLEISYLTLPLRFDSISIAKDPANSAMLTVSGEATYTGP